MRIILFMWFWLSCVCSYAQVFWFTTKHSVGGCPTNAPNDYVSYWRFNGNAIDETGNNNGTITGSTARSDQNGVPGQALDFDGDNDNVYFSQAPFTDNSSFTVSGWIFPEGVCTCPTSQNSGVILDARHDPSGVRMMITWQDVNNSSGANCIRAYVELSDYILQYSDVNSVMPNTWSFFAFSFNDGVCKMYINGVLQNTLTASFTTLNTNNIGVSKFGKDYLPGTTHDRLWFNGGMSDFRYYDYVLTDTQIQNIYNQENCN